MKTQFTTKAIVALAFFSLFANNINAQIVKGSWSLGPNFRYSSLKTEIDALDVDIKTTDLNLAIGAGYYLIDNLELALVVGITSSSSDFEGIESKTSGLNLGPQLHYKVPISGHFYLPVGGGFRYNSLTNEDDNSDETTFNGLSYYLFAGIEYIENNKLGAFLSIGPEFGTFKNPDTDDEFDTNNFGVGMGFVFYF